MMKKNNFLNELMSVDIPTGRLRLAILVVLLFITWSLCAIVTSMVDPFYSLPTWLSTGLLSDSINNGNLAASLLRDILSSYLSLYAIAYLSLLIAAILVTHHIIKQLILFIFPRIKASSIGKFLHQSAFSISDYPLVNISTENTTENEDLAICRTLGGPAYIQIEPELSVIVKDNKGLCRTVPTNLPDDEAFFLRHQEKVVSISHQEKILLLHNLNAICGDGYMLSLSSLRLSYAWISDSSEDEKAAQNKARVMQGQDAQSLLIDLIKNEIRALFLNYSQTEIRHNLLAPDALPEEPVQLAPVSHKRHNIPSHGRLYAAPANFIRQAGNSIILRNRRRSLLPELRVYENVNTDMLVEDQPDFINELSDQLSQSVNAIFGSHVLNIKIENIGKVSLNAIHLL